MSVPVASAASVPPAAAATPNRVRMVVLSDIHATEAGDPRTNVAQSTAGDAKANALSAAREMMVSEFAPADVLLCPGDLVHGGETGPMKWVWEELHATAAGLGAYLVGTAGNHDLLREPTGPQTPFDGLRRLDPEFPCDDDSSVMSYWGHDFAIVQTSSWRVVTLNSCAQHGGFDKDETEHGRLRQFCLPRLEKYLDKLGGGPRVNVCMCHHQPQEWTLKGDNRTNHMLEGDLLIELLDRRPERWLLINGHKHHPALGYFGNGSAGPVRLAAGSVGADLLGDSGVEVRNQLHVIDFHLDAEPLGLMLAGEIQCFDWEPGTGWVEPGARSGLPARPTFGYRRDGHELAVWLLGEARARDQRTWSWPEIVALEPRCAYLIPQDQEVFFDGVRSLGGGQVSAPDPHDFLEVTFQW